VRRNCFLLVLFAIITAAVPLNAQTPAPSSSSQTSTQSAEAANLATSQPNSTTEYRLSKDRYEKAVAYSRNGYIRYFISTIWGIVVLILLLNWQVIAKIRDFAERCISRPALQAIIFVPLLIFLLAIFDLPLSIYGHSVSLRYEQSVQHWGSWFWDWTKGQLLTAVIAIIVALILYGVIRWKPRTWWLYFWFASIPLIIFLVFISPWLVDPLFHKFTPLQDSHPALVDSIEKLTQRAGMPIPRDRMFLMQASEKSTQINAYVTGLGASKRVVVWDNAISKTKPDELLFIVGHEMGHYALGHVFKGLAAAIVGLFIELYLAYWLLQWALKRWGQNWGIRGQDDWAALAVLLLIFSVLGFFADPIGNSVSRSIEHAADVYGLEVTHGIVPNSQEAAAHAFQVLGEEDLSDPNPPRFITFWLYSHPPLDDRLKFAHSYDPWGKGQPPKYVKQLRPFEKLPPQDFFPRPPCRRKNAATLWRFPHRAIEHHLRRCVRESSQKNSRQAGFAQRRIGASGPSTSNSAADRAIAATSHSSPPSRAMNCKLQESPLRTNSSWPSVTRRISLIGSTHTDGKVRRCTTAPKIARTDSRTFKMCSSAVSTACGSLCGKCRRRAARSSPTRAVANRKDTNSSHERSRAAGTTFAKSSAKRPATSSAKQDSSY
jgi:Zn-dependent protease with chaperone function